MADEKPDQRRTIRIDGNCPILYSHSSHVQWLVGMLANLSEQGICFLSRIPLPVNETILVQCKPQGDARIPRQTCRARVLRCHSASDGYYRVACLLIPIPRDFDNGLPQRHHPGILPA